jgi:hypothetical protein
LVLLGERLGERILHFLFRGEAIDDGEDGFFFVVFRPGSTATFLYHIVPIVVQVTNL